MNLIGRFLGWNMLDSNDFLYKDKPVLNEAFLETISDSLLFYRNHCTGQIKALTDYRNTHAMTMLQSQEVREKLEFYEKEKRRFERAIEANRRLKHQVRSYPAGVQLDFRAAAIIREEE